MLTGMPPSPPSSPSSSSLLMRLLRRVLSRGRGEARAVQEALHLAGVIRFLAVFAGTVVLPTLLLAYYGVASIGVEEQSVAAEVERDGAAAAEQVWRVAERRFSAFEDRATGRLAAGRSPLEGLGELSPHLRTALRFDAEGRLVAPFVEESRPDPAAAADALDPAWAAAAAAERRGDPKPAVARLFLAAARGASRSALDARSRYDHARVLARAGQDREALAALDALRETPAGLRDAWGMPVSALVHLERGEILLRTDPPAGRAALRDLVEELMAARWAVGEGGDAAVLRRALALLESAGEGEYAAATRGRAAERSAMLFWTGRLAAERQQVLGAVEALRMGPGTVRWRMGTEALWATTWWAGDFYAFALDLGSLAEELKADTRGATLPDALVSIYLLEPGVQEPEDALAVKRLAPWLPGWSVAAVPRDATALERARKSKRAQRAVVVGLALLLVGVGGMFSVRLVRRELDFARMQTDFAANVSHELRSPITQIRVTGESLMFGLAETEAEREEAYTAIVRESERLSRLVDNVLDFAAIEHGAKQYALREGDLVDSVYRALDSISSARELEGKELDVDLPEDLPPVAHDPDAVAQCVLNLVSNAAKYSPAGGWIGVRGRRVEGAVEVTVSDKGIGIAAHDLQSVFEPFYRSRDAQARQRKGTGIGLTITRYIMRAHGGDVLVQSRPGHGSTFILRFPFPAPGPSRRPAHPRSPRA